MNLREKIVSLLDKSNETTSQSRTNLTDATKDLVQGYGGGGISADMEVISFVPSLIDAAINTNITRILTTITVELI